MSFRKTDEHDDYDWMTNIRILGNGRPSCTATRDDRFVVSTMLRVRLLTTVQTRNRFQDKKRRTRTRHCDNFVKLILGLIDQEMAPKISRKIGMLEHAWWTEEHWSKVVCLFGMFSNEYKFRLFAHVGDLDSFRRMVTTDVFEVKMLFGGD